jgi:hypothetical protein
MIPKEKLGRVLSLDTLGSFAVAPISFLGNDRSVDRFHWPIDSLRSRGIALLNYEWHSIIYVRHL